METGIVSSPGYEASGSTTCVIQPTLLLNIRSISGRLKKICAEIIAGHHKGITLRVLLQSHANSAENYTPFIKWVLAEY